MTGTIRSSSTCDHSTSGTSETGSAPCRQQPPPSLATSNGCDRARQLGRINGYARAWLTRLGTIGQGAMPRVLNAGRRFDVGAGRRCATPCCRRRIGNGHFRRWRRRPGQYVRDKARRGRGGTHAYAGTSPASRIRPWRNAPTLSRIMHTTQRALRRPMHACPRGCAVPCNILRPGQPTPGRWHGARVCRGAHELGS